MPGDRCNRALEASDCLHDYVWRRVLAPSWLWPTMWSVVLPTPTAAIVAASIEVALDWDDCDDAQYWTYIPVQTKSEAQQKLGPLQLLEVESRLQKDFPNGARVLQVYWIGK
jgi:hypothetical protein